MTATAELVQSPVSFFRVGDRVRYVSIQPPTDIGTHLFYSDFAGREGTVIELFPEDDYRLKVKLDDYSLPRFLAPHLFEFISREEYRVGDHVRFIGGKVTCIENKVGIVTSIGNRNENLWPYEVEFAEAKCPCAADELMPVFDAEIPLTQVDADKAEAVAQDIVEEERDEFHHHNYLKHDQSIVVDSKGDATVQTTETTAPDGWTIEVSLDGAMEAIKKDPKTLLDTVANVIGAQSAVGYFLGELTASIPPSDEGYVYRYRASMTVNGGWVEGSPCRMVPDAWIEQLAANTKLLTLAMLLSTDADDHGRVLSAIPSRYAKIMKVSTEKVLAYIVQLAAFGILDFYWPQDQLGKLRINIQLHTEPAALHDNHAKDAA